MNRRKETRREYARAEVDWPVDVEAGVDTLKGRIKNISRGGALIHLTKKLDIHEHIRLGIEIPLFEDVIFAKGRVIRSFSTKTGYNIDSFGIGVEFTEISNEDLRYFTGNLAEEWREDYRESTGYQKKMSYFKPTVYGLGIFFLISIAIYSMRFRNGNQLVREQIIELSKKIVALEGQLTSSRSAESDIERLENNFHEVQDKLASNQLGREQITELTGKVIALEERLTSSRSIESDIERLENNFHEVQEQLASMQRKSEPSVNIGNLQIQNKQFKEDVVVTKSSTEHPLLSEIKIVPDTQERADFVYYVVENGDNLYRISMKYKIGVNKIKELNKIANNDSIHPGQKLIVGWQ